jgi:hypothetical protein
MSSARKLPRKDEENAHLLKVMLEMQRLSGKYPEGMLGVLIRHLRTSTSPRHQLRIRAALDGLLATMPLSDPDLIDKPQPISNYVQ